MTAAFVVTWKGRLIAERYGDGISAQTPLESWSMGKSVTATLMGVLIQQGVYALDQPAAIPEWQKPGDPRRQIRIRDLMHMSSGIRIKAPDDPDFTIPLGPADVKRDGTDITVFAYGLMLHHSLKAAETLSNEGISVAVVDVRSLRPLDAATILREARKTGKCLIVYEDNRLFGAGAEIAALIAEEAFDALDAPVMRLAGPEVPAMPYNKPQEDWFMPDPEKIATKMRELAAY